MVTTIQLAKFILGLTTEAFPPPGSTRYRTDCSWDLPSWIILKRHKNLGDIRHTNSFSQKHDFVVAEYDLAD